MSEILKRERDSNPQIHVYQDLFDKKKSNQQTIIGLFSTKKRLLSLPGISFTQVNMTQGPQQINNTSNENAKPKEEI